MITVSLIGEQPIPNLLPLRYQPPRAVVLVHSNRTEGAARRLERLLPPDCEPVYCPTSAYDIWAASRNLASLIEKRGWSRLSSTCGARANGRGCTATNSKPTAYRV